MLRFENPLDPSKDGQNPFIDGLKFHIRNSEMLKEQIIHWIRKNEDVIYNMTNLEILKLAMNYLHILDNELTITDEHAILDWIQEWQN